jgi:hypothetical protein
MMFTHWDEAYMKLDATAQWREEIIDPLIEVWDALDLRNTDDAFVREWKGVARRPDRIVLPL